VPIICIANDGYNQKIKSLKNYCLELKFSKPMHTMVVKRLKMIAEVFNFMYLISESLCRATRRGLTRWWLRSDSANKDKSFRDRMVCLRVVCLCVVCLCLGCMCLCLGLGLACCVSVLSP
jgi:hypothetical protein